MTDAEIKKALECCANYGLLKCNKCPMRNGSKTCMYDLSKLALDLINRQQAEIKTLQERNVVLRGMIDTQKAEIERLQNKVEELADVLSNSIRIRYAEVKAEAIKEFADKLKGTCYTYSDICGYESTVIDITEIDNLVKEMVGDAE